MVERGLKVLVCGVPSSGNKLTRNIVNRAIRATGNNYDCVDIAHLPRDIEHRKKRHPGIDKAIIPIRAQVFQEQSFKLSGYDPEVFPTQEKLLPLIFETLTELGIEYRIITYESLLMHPKEVVKDMCDFVGVPVPDPIALDPFRDANLRYCVIE